MRSCDEVLELISAALDGPLTGAEQAALDEHLSRCPACSALFEELRGLHAAAAELDDVPAPAGFAGRVMDAIAAAPAQEPSGHVVPFPGKKKRARTPWKGWTATAAVIAVVVLGAVALPGPFGATSKNAATGSSADCAAPASAQAADVSAPMEDADGENGTLRSNATMDAGDSMPESEIMYEESIMTADSQENSAGKDSGTLAPFSAAAPLTASCGTITLTGEPLPEGLETYAYTEDEQGNRIYEVPADYFFSCLDALEAERSDRFTWEPGQEDGEYGLILVEAP